MLPPDANMKGRVITIPVVNLFINLLGLQHAVHKIKILNDYETSKKKKKKKKKNHKFLFKVLFFV